VPWSNGVKSVTEVRASAAGAYAATLGRCSKGSSNVYTTAEEWVERFISAGCTMRVDVASLYPLRAAKNPVDCLRLWDEIHGPGNYAKWKEVEALVRAKVGPLVGWVDFPSRD